MKDKTIDKTIQRRAHRADRKAQEIEAVVLEAIKIATITRGGATNREIVGMLGGGPKYRRVQRATHALHAAGLITGRLNQWGIRSNVTWRKN